MIDQPLTDFVEWSVNFAFWGAVAFPVVIRRVWPWWRDWFGQTMVAVDLCFAAACLGLVLRYDFGIRFAVLAWIDAIGLSLSFLVLVWRTVMIFRAQRRPLPPALRAPAAAEEQEAP